MKGRKANGYNTIRANDQKGENQIFNSGTLWIVGQQFKEGGLQFAGSLKGFVHQDDDDNKLGKDSFVGALPTLHSLSVLVEKVEGFWKISRGKKYFTELIYLWAKKNSRCREL